MFTYAVIFPVISIIAGALGMTNTSQIAKRVSLVLFALFFILFLGAVGLIYLVSEPAARPASAPPPLLIAGASLAA